MQAPPEEGVTTLQSVPPCIYIWVRVGPIRTGSKMGVGVDMPPISRKGYERRDLRMGT